MIWYLYNSNSNGDGIYDKKLSYQLKLKYKNFRQLDINLFDTIKLNKFDKVIISHERNYKIIDKLSGQQLSKINFLIHNAPTSFRTNSFLIYPYQIFINSKNLYLKYKLKELSKGGLNIVFVWEHDYFFLKKLYINSYYINCGKHESPESIKKDLKFFYLKKYPIKFVYFPDKSKWYPKKISFFLFRMNIFFFNFFGLISDKRYYHNNKVLGIDYDLFSYGGKQKRIIFKQIGIKYFYFSKQSNPTYNGIFIKSFYDLFNFDYNSFNYSRSNESFSNLFNWKQIAEKIKIK